MEIVDQPAIVAAARRAEIAMSEMRPFFDTAYTAVASAAGAGGGTISGPAIAWYSRMPAETADVTAGFPVAGLEVGPLADDVDVVEIPGGRSAVATAVGPYEKLGESWQALAEWAAAQGETPRGDFAEHYVTEPTPDGDPDKNVTRLILPLV
ncbi:effector-binding domain-containing protein [Paraoerskovia marina]|uniref:Effector-binding domain-containing protein n=2 Tax=Paraoerskovia marina TaxID=545619 RepID=A0A1H1MVU3_9CELL|nr:effector-binding domain-containing protein [Paraoerskovia marina]